MAAPITESQRCTFHPEVETRLSCSKCGTPICPRCMVSTPVGYRCPDCAGVRGLPTYETSLAVLIKAGVIGALIASLVGVLWGYYPQWQFYLALILGFGVAEGMAWAANYKRGRDLQIAAIACVMLGIVLSRVFIAQNHPILGLDDMFNNALNPGVSRTFQMRLLPDVAFIVLAAAIPFVRFR